MVSMDFIKFIPVDRLACIAVRIGRFSNQQFKWISFVSIFWDYNIGCLSEEEHYNDVEIKFLSQLNCKCNIFYIE